jgi:hypothetical protein
MRKTAGLIGRICRRSPGGDFNHVPPFWLKGIAGGSSGMGEHRVKRRLACSTRSFALLRWPGRRAISSLERPVDQADGSRSRGQCNSRSCASHGPPAGPLPSAEYVCISVAELRLDGERGDMRRLFALSGMRYMPCFPAPQNRV